MNDSWERFYVDPVQLGAFYRQMLGIRSQCARLAQQTRDPAWVALGREVQVIQEQFDIELQAIGKQVAIEADKAILQVLNSKMLRQPTGIRPGLRDSIFSAAVPTAPFSHAEVEIAWVSKLEEAVGATGAPYWRTQEYGYKGNIGRVIFGTFFGSQGGDVPSQLMFRQHPVFIPGPGGPGTIARPIPGKHFLKQGTAVAADIWMQLVRNAVMRCAAKLQHLAIP